MRPESTVHTMRNRGCGVASPIVLVAAGVLLLAPAAPDAADPKGPAAGGKSPTVTLEAVPGSGVLRVTLTAKAAERLGIETGKVGEEPVLRKQMVSGLIVAAQQKQMPPRIAGPVPTVKPVAGGIADFSRIGPAPVAAPPVAAQTAAAPPTAPRAGAPADTRDVWVLVTLSPREWERLAQDKPARVLPLATREKETKEVVAEPTGIVPVEDPKRSMMTLYYKVPGKDHGLALGSRMRVELPLAGADAKQKVVPYGAVYYDSKGVAWVYVVTKPLTYERQRVGVDRVVGDVAVLSEGPAVGTPIVTVGAALLYGAEIFKK